MKTFYAILMFYVVCVTLIHRVLTSPSAVPFLKVDQKSQITVKNTTVNMTHLPFIYLADKASDSSEFWLMTELLQLVNTAEMDVDYDTCEKTKQPVGIIKFPTRRTVRPICRTRIDFQLCPQCPHFTNHSECELFRESCREKRVPPSQYLTYCDKKYGKWRTMFVPADYSKCRCCDECIFYRELDQSCVQDEQNFEMEENLPVTTIDFRAGCNPYVGHPEQEMKALRCDKHLRRCIPVSLPVLPHENIHGLNRRSFRFEPPSDAAECPSSCRGYTCPHGELAEGECPPGAFIPNKDQCNCCGRCSSYQQLNDKCAEYRQTLHDNNGTQEIEVEEEFLEPGCDDGLVCRQGRCQDIHNLEVPFRRMRRGNNEAPYEPCKKELKLFKKKYGTEGHLHYEAPQCTPLWLYAPVQCRRFVCYCALEDGTKILGVKVPRVEVSNMNCDCARAKCRESLNVECDGYGNYKEAVFTKHVDSNVQSK